MTVYIILTGVFAIVTTIRLALLERDVALLKRQVLIQGTAKLPRHPDNSGNLGDDSGPGTRVMPELLPFGNFDLR